MRIELLNTGTFRLRRRLRASQPWTRALETPALWVFLFLVLGTWALMPGAFLFSARAVPGSIAARDYVASRDLLVSDDDATRANQEQARQSVLPVYDYDPRVNQDFEDRLGQLFAAGAQEGAVARDLLASASGMQLRLTPAQAELLTRKRLAAPLKERLLAVAGRALRRGVVGNKSLLLENRMRGISLRDLGSGTETVQLDLFDRPGLPWRSPGLPGIRDRRLERLHRPRAHPPGRPPAPEPADQPASQPE